MATAPCATAGVGASSSDLGPTSPEILTVDQAYRVGGSLLAVTNRAPPNLRTGDEVHRMHPSGQNGVAFRRRGMTWGVRGEGGLPGQTLIRAEVGSYIGRSDTSTGCRTPAMSTCQVPASIQSGVTGSPPPDTMASPTAPPSVQPYDAVRT